MQAGYLVVGGEPNAAARARSFVRSTLRLAPPDLVDDAELVVTELVTNAQLHGAGPIAVRASWAEPCVLVEVQDHGRVPRVSASEVPAPSAWLLRAILWVQPH